MKIHKKEIGSCKWEFWYDRSYRCWFAMKVNEDGDQIEDSVNAATKGEIIYAMELESVD